MNCALCSQKISQGKDMDFYGDVLCGNCHRRLKVGKHKDEHIDDPFIPALISQENDCNRAITLSRQWAHLGKRAGRVASVDIMLTLLQRLNGGKADRSFVTCLLLVARTLALHGDNSEKRLMDTETRYLINISMDVANMLEVAWENEPAMRAKVLRAFLGNIMRAHPSNRELAEKIWSYISSGY
ncbi:MAG TPA: hypothetical protein ENN76_00490 [Euryarchaeota archaeon]|nr:hypothetical protein [Euryarchaeota archaeon]